MNYRLGMEINTSFRYYRLRPQRTGDFLPLVLYAIPTWRNGDGPFWPISHSCFGLN